MTIVPLPASTPAKPTGWPLLRAPHRPFFFVAAAWAFVALLAWLAAWHGWLPLTAAWHGHEMIFGMAAAAASGFLLTAVPTWTTGKPLIGRPLAALLALWVVGRGAMLVGGAVAWLDLLFLPALAAIIGTDILRTANRRNYPVPAMLLLLTLCNADYHFGDTYRALWLATLLLTAMIALIGGRITPMFTQNALRMAGARDLVCRTPPLLEALSIPAVILAAAVELAFPQSVWSGAAALPAAVVLAARMLGWHSLATRHSPILWILHAGYAWLPVGYALIAVSLLTDALVPTAALHALSAGAIGVMILAVMSRAALGHSGRPLTAPRLTAIAYVLVNIGAVLRVVVPVSEGAIAAGLVWTAAYGLFLIDYWPILTRPRIDGRPG